VARCTSAKVSSSHYTCHTTVLISFSENWDEAFSDFFESFKNYDEAGSLQRIQVLKYLVLTTMLTKSNISPFDSQETKPYKNDHRISAMTDLVDAYQRDDIHGYEKILQKNKDLLADPFIAENIDEVTRNMRTKAMLKLIAPYTRFTLASLSEKLQIPLTEVQDILGYLIVNKQLRGKIDQRTGIVQVENRLDIERVNAIKQWTEALGRLSTTVLSEDSHRSDEGSGFYTAPGSSQPSLIKHINGGVGRMRVGSSHSGHKRLGGVLRG
jgi:COP9 signalosome complex subunit 2